MVSWTGTPMDITRSAHKHIFQCCRNTFQRVTSLQWSFPPLQNFDACAPHPWNSNKPFARHRWKTKVKQNSKDNRSWRWRWNIACLVEDPCSLSFPTAEWRMEGDPNKIQSIFHEMQEIWVMRSVWFRFSPAHSFYFPVENLSRSQWSYWRWIVKHLDPGLEARQCVIFNLACWRKYGTRMERNNLMLLDVL